MARKTTKSTTRSRTTKPAAGKPAVEDAEVVADPDATTDEAGASGDATPTVAAPEKPENEPAATEAEAGAGDGDPVEADVAGAADMPGTAASDDAPASAGGEPVRADPMLMGADATQRPDDAMRDEGAAAETGDTSATGAATGAGDDTPSEPTGTDPERSDPPASTALAAPPSAAQGKRGPGFLPLVLGGLVAGAIGYAVPTYLMPEDVAGVDPERVAALESDLAALRDVPAADAVDLTPVTEVQAALSDRVAALEAQVADLAATPTPEAGPVTEASTAAVDTAAEAGTETMPETSPPPAEPGAAQADLDALAARVDGLAETQASIEARLADLDGIAQRLDALETGSGDIDEAVAGLRADLGGRIDALSAELAEVETQTIAAEDEAEALAREAAINQIRIALDSGAAYAEPLENLAAVPDPLAAPATEGVATQGDLVAAFPPLAREALRTARAGQSGGGLSNALGSLFSARSLEPREGDDPDAVLSRAEAAVRAGDLDAALTEIAALPEDARAVLADWVARVETRRDAKTALQDYLQDG